MAAIATEARSTGVRVEEEEEAGPEAEAEAFAIRGEDKSLPPMLLPIPFPFPEDGEGATQTATSARRGGDQADLSLFVWVLWREGEREMTTRLERYLKGKKLEAMK